LSKVSDAARLLELHLFALRAGSLEAFQQRLHEIARAHEPSA
jgi:hypothetical protein